MALWFRGLILVPIPTIGRVEISLDEPQFRWMREHGALHVPDLREQKEFPMFGSGGIARTLLGRPPSSKRGTRWNLDAPVAARYAPSPRRRSSSSKPSPIRRSSPSRMCGCSKSSRSHLEQQTATSEILGVIASSPTDIQPVLDVVAENAARLCDATDAVIHRIDGDKLRSVANYGSLPTRRMWDRSIAMDRDSIPGRAVIDRRTLHIHDLAAVPEDDLRSALRQKSRCSDGAIHAVAARGNSHRDDSYPPHGGPPVYREADQTARNLCRPGRDRH